MANYIYACCLYPVPTPTIAILWNHIVSCHTTSTTHETGGSIKRGRQGAALAAGLNTGCGIPHAQRSANMKTRLNTSMCRSCPQHKSAQICGNVHLYYYQVQQHECLQQQQPTSTSTYSPYRSAPRNSSSGMIICGCETTREFTC